MEGRKEEPGGQWHPDNVVADGPEEIQSDALHHLFGEVDRRRHVTQRRLHQHNIRCFDGHVGTRANGDADVFVLQQQKKKKGLSPSLLAYDGVSVSSSSQRYRR